MTGVQTCALPISKNYIENNKLKEKLSSSDLYPAVEKIVDALLPFGYSKQPSFSDMLSLPDDSNAELTQRHSALKIPVADKEIIEGKKIFNQTEQIKITKTKTSENAIESLSKRIKNIKRQNTKGLEKLEKIENDKIGRAHV